jgi:hypothetical protein
MTDVNQKSIGLACLEPTSFSDIASPTLRYGPTRQFRVWAGTTQAITGALTELNMIKACDTARQNGARLPSSLRHWEFAGLTSRCTQQSVTSIRRLSPVVSGLPLTTVQKFRWWKIRIVLGAAPNTGQMYYMDETKIKVRKKPWYFSDPDGSIFKWVSGFDSWEGLMGARDTAFTATFCPELQSPKQKSWGKGPLSSHRGI